jgi:DNA-binding protein HU-beta
MPTGTMTKTQLLTHLTERMGAPITRKTAGLFLDELTQIAIRETKKNGIFVMPGIGRLVKAHRKARMGRNPQNGETIKIAAKTVVKFRVAKAVKEAIAPGTTSTRKAA